MVVETRRGKRKDNPTEEEGPRVKFAKTGSGENVEKTTTEESEMRAMEVVESMAKTMDESTAKTTDVSTEKTRKDSSENTAEMTEPFNVVAEAAPTTLNKGPGDEENEETASGDEVNEKTASGDEVNEGSEKEQEKLDGEKESSNQDHEDSEEEPPDGENEVNARSEEEQANGEGEEEATEWVNLGTRCMIVSAIKTLSNLKPKLSNAEWNWFTEHPQFRHIFHMKSENNHRVQGMWMLFLRTAGCERRREVWFILNGVAIRYGLREHGLISGLFCHNYPLGYKKLGGTKFVDRHFKEGGLRRLEDVKKKLVNMGPHKDRLKMTVLFFLASVVCAQTKVGHKANPVLEVFQRAVDDLDLCKSFPWGRFSYDYMLKEISHTMKHFGGVVKEVTLWPLPGFCVPLELLAFEAIPKLGLAFREPVEEADVNCPRMCKSSFKRNGMTRVSLSAINKELSNTTDIDSIIPTRTPQEEKLLDDILEDEDDVDESDLAVDSWEKCLDAGYKVFFQDMHDEDVVARQKQAEASEAAGGDGTEAGEQSIQLGDVMKLVKRTLKLMRTVDKKVDQLDGRLAPLEEFVKEAQAKAAEEEEAPAQEKAKKHKRMKK
ncbi:hypothetical protein Bca4012_073446 [Brassica carinata]